MYLIQLLLPLYTNNGKAVSPSLFDQVQYELKEKFGGITSYVRSPAKGLWKESEDKTVADDVVTFEVMLDEVDKKWWEKKRKDLELQFEQKELTIRYWEIHLF
jgi:hypothetical protein